MLVHLCFAGDGLAEAVPAGAWAATVEPDDRAADVCALAVARVPVVAAPAAVRPRARPPARTPDAMAAPATGRKILNPVLPCVLFTAAAREAAGRDGLARRDQYARRNWSGSRCGL